MKAAKKHFLRALAASAEGSVEEAVAEAAGYANADVMRAALAKTLFNHPDVRKAAVALHKEARKAAKAPKLKPRGVDIRKLDGHVQASRLQPRKHR